MRDNVPDFSFLKERRPRVIGEREARHSAVAIPLMETPEGLVLLFEVRSERLHQQPGDICFPGGGVEPGETPEEAAVREMEEELLVKGSQIEVIGPADIFAGGTRQVHTFVCRLKDYDGRFSRSEVGEVFTVPLAFFLTEKPEVHIVSWRPEFGADFPFEKIHGGKAYPWRSQRDRILFYEYQGHVIWGMTARIIEAFVETLHSSGEGRNDG